MLWCCEEHKKKWLLIASSSAKCFGFDSIRPVDLDHMCWDLSSEMTQIWSLDQIWSQSHQTTFQAEPRAQWWLSKHPSRAYLWICVGAYWNPNKVCFLYFMILWIVSVLPWSCFVFVKILLSFQSSPCLAISSNFRSNGELWLVFLLKKNCKLDQNSRTKEFL